MLEPGDNIGRYRIVELIGQGGMGAVYLAEDTELRRRVAIKLFTRDVGDATDARESLLREARAASALSHPNVCTVFEVGEDGERPFIVMEYVEGPSLDALIARRDLPAERVIRYGAQIADAVGHAHANGVVHRDLKSANVVLTPDGRAKVLDFGLASTRAAESDTATRDVTSADVGTVSGTLSYMAPEILRGSRADARSDIWAIGVILFEASVGRLPFAGETGFEVSTAVMKDSVDVPDEVLPGLRAVIRRCLEKAPGERYQSAAEIRAALEALQSSTTGVPAVPSATPSATPSDAVLSTAGARVTVLAAVAVAAIALAAWWTLGADDDEASQDPGIEAAATAAAAIGASGRPTIAVLPFRNRTGAEDLGWLAEGVPSMLLTSLAQTDGLDVVSKSRVQELVAQLGHDSLQELDAATLGEFARRSGAGAVVVGDLYYTGTEYRFDVQVEDVVAGRVIDAHSASGPFVFDLVDELAALIVADLSLAGGRPAASIADVTTGSLEAWRHYEEGITARANVRYRDAVLAFEQAVAVDPDFVMAYYQLARLSGYLPDPSKAAEYDAFVAANMDRVPERDRLLVEAMHAYERDEDFARAEQLLEELVQEYPDHESGWLRLVDVQSRGGVLGFNAEQVATLERATQAMPASGGLFNQFGYALAHNGRYTEAVRAIEHYVELHPGEPNAYDSLAEMYLLSGQPEAAFDMYGEILEIDPRWFGSHFGRAITAAMSGRYETAFEELERYQELWIDVNGTSSGGYAPTRAMMLSKLGRYEEALELLLTSRDRAASGGTALAQKGLEIIGMHIATESDDAATARAFAAEALEGVENVEIPAAREGIADGSLAYRAIWFLREGDIDAARQLADRLSDAPIAGMISYSGLLEAEIALASGNAETAEQLFRDQQPTLKMFFSAAAPIPSLLFNNDQFRDGVARALVARGEIDEAIRAYRDLTTVDISSTYNAFLDPRYILRLAELLDQAGRVEEARGQYLRFIELWDGADPRFQPTVERARRRADELAG